MICQIMYIQIDNCDTGNNDIEHCTCQACAVKIDDNTIGAPQFVEHRDRFGCDGGFVDGCRVLAPLSNVWVTLLAVVVGGVVYSVLVLKLVKRFVMN